MESSVKGKKVNIANFGKGWGIILYCLAMFWFYVGMCNDGTNATAPAVAEKLAVDVGVIYNMNAIGGLIGIIIFIVAGQVNRRIGARITSGVFCIIAGCAYMVLGNAPSVEIYALAYSFTIGGIMSAGYIAGGTLVATWFPKTKGVVMGYTTMGHNLASAFYVPIMMFLMSLKPSGVSFGVVPIGVGCIILGIIGIIFVRNTPSERGQNPDNVTDEVYKTEYDTSSEENDDGWTTKSLLKCKELWIASIATGCFQICSTGIMSTLVLRNLEIGFSIEIAMTIMSICAFVGIVGSWSIGILDDKFGTKRTMLGFGVWYASALLCNATQVMPMIYLSIFMIGMGIGGSANFTTSLPTSIFGRQGFDKVNSVIFPIQGAITALCFAINGIVSQLTGGSYRWSYVIFAGIAILASILVTTIDDKKYNRDFKAENA
ncbi:MFS transporter permease [Candidatus Epulonipiscium fishelsonii]|uniref:MFS transporter permease n=1 Tax=Candidatus Epulonipiscium fishelsonii TaxID=77094 RepID=A0ACC8X9G7_9FIRM|nr:MFS transporter permease [Epulopiscium sp. SCG-B11WGA-EpuloA1]ONI41708.1 MFS transporter permease [Epulopiscium sp. SCG-B05WGA-EpuloA1]